MLDIVLIVLPIFLVLVLGHILKRMGLITPDFVSVSNRLIFMVCLPVLLFYKISQANLYEVFSVTYIVIMFAAIAVMFVFSFFWAFIMRYRKETTGTFAMNNFRANYAYMGLPVSFYAFGDPGLLRASVLMAFIVPFVNLLSVIALVMSSGEKVSRTTFMKNTLLNPLAVACLLGIIFSLARIELPVFMNRTLDIISGVTLPLALFAIGATLNPRQLKGRLDCVITSTVFKLMGLPLIAWLMLTFLTDEVSLTAKVMIVMLASPSATVNYVLAATMKGDTEVASSTIVATTTLSIVSFVFWLHLLGV